MTTKNNKSGQRSRVGWVEEDAKGPGDVGCAMTKEAKGGNATRRHTRSDGYVKCKKICSNT